MGLYLVGLTRYQEAREPLQQAIALAPLESYYYWAMGDSYLLENPDEEHFRKATSFYRRALQLNPKNEKALYAYGMALARHGRREDLPKAVELFKRLLRIHPVDMNAELKLAELLKRMRRT